MGKFGAWFAEAALKARDGSCAPIVGTRASDDAVKLLKRWDDVRSAVQAHVDFHEWGVSDGTVTQQKLDEARIEAESELDEMWYEIASQMHGLIDDAMNPSVSYSRNSCCRMSK